MVGGGVGATIGTGQFNEGDTVKLDAGKHVGFSFAGWSGPVKFANPNRPQTSFIMPAGSVKVHTNWKPNRPGKDAYSPLVGNGRSDDRKLNWRRGGSRLEFTIYTPHRDIVSIIINGIRLLRGTHYDVREGSTIVSLAPEYLDTLNQGTSNLSVEFRSPSGTAELTLDKSDVPVPSSPSDPSGDTGGSDGGGGGCSSFYGSIWLAAASMIALAVRRRQQ